MLDTGIDVPEVVNLVFAKPVYSFVKFWQMIGRGTRLCSNLFGLGRHKTHFMIFDHWNNFNWFDQTYKPAEPALTKSLLQQLFEARVRLAEAALVAQDQSAFRLAISLIANDLASLPEKSIAVREKWKEVKTLSRTDTLQQFAAVTEAALLQDIAPLMQWVNIAGHEEAYQFDRLVCQLQIDKLKGSGKFVDLKDELIAQVSELRINLTQVAVKVPVIDRVKTAHFWLNCTVETLEEIREEIRGVMKYHLARGGPALPPKVIDVREDASLVERGSHKVQLDGLDLVAYRNRVLKVLTDLFETNPTLQKIKSGEPVNGQDLEDLCSLVLTQEPGLDLRDLTDYYPESAGHLEQAIRGIIGLDAQAVHDRFTRFVHQHAGLASHQVKFLDLLQNYISQYGSIEVDRLYEPPFTILDSDGLDGVFPDEALAQELLSVIDSFRPQLGQEGPAQ
jgi:type I restriction enzyme R subunit